MSKQTMFESTRRQFLSSVSTGAALLATARQTFAEVAGGSSNARAKRCVVLWMNGGPSQFETFDPKPGTSTGGPTEAIATNVPGIHLSQHLPQLAKRADKLAVVRSVTSNEGEHERAQYYLHTGFQLVPAFPRPALGSVISLQHEANATPNYVLLGDQPIGPAYCGPDHAAFAIENANSAKQLLGQIENRNASIDLLRQLGQGFDDRNRFPDVERRSAMLSKLQSITETPFRNSLDLAQEKDATRMRYGDHLFGRRCLTARRLLEIGVPFVEVQLNGWDTHTDNFAQVQRLARPMDQAWSALIDDLVSSGLWDDTLILWMGDFGRTPIINANNGRDHFPSSTPVVFSGGAVRGGQVIGQTNTDGTAIDGKTHRVADVAATLLSRLGVAPDQTFQTSFGSPTEATDDGIPVESL